MTLLPEAVSSLREISGTRRTRICHLSVTKEVDSERMYVKEALAAQVHGYAVDVHGLPPVFATNGKADIQLHSLPRQASKLRLRSLIEACRVALSTDADVLHVHDLQSLLAGSVGRLRRQYALLYDAHENYPMVHSKNLRVRGRNLGSLRPYVEYMITAFERLCCKAVDHVIAVDEFIAAKFTDWGVPTTVVRNAAWKENPLDEVGSVASAEPLATELAEKFVFVYLGAVTRQVAARECVQAMSEVQDVQPKSVLLFVGGFADATYEQEVLEEIRLRGLKYSVIILDQIPYSRVFSVLSCAHVGLILYSAENNYRDRVIFPHKLCDYCRAGLPMLVSNFDGLVRVTGDFGMGIAVDPTDPAAIARGMLAFAQNPGLTAAMSAASCAFFTDHLNWEAEQRKLMTIYNQLASSAERQRGRCSWLPIPTRRESEHGNQ